MILGRVVGQVWAARKDSRLEGRKLLVIEPYGLYDPPLNTQHLVAIDTLHAGEGDDVVVCLGTPARAQLGGVNFPVEAAVMAIVDRCEVVKRELGHKRSFQWMTSTPPRNLSELAS